MLKIEITTDTIRELIRGLEAIEDMMSIDLDYLHIEHVEGTDKIHVVAKTLGYEEEQEQ